MTTQEVKLVRPALIQPRGRICDAARWTGYQPRPEDIMICTYAKCGTTWTQHIVGMLVFGNAEPRAVFEMSPWPDFRFIMPKGAIWPIAEAQTHRRFFKSHLPLQALPLYERVKYIHVARDGRDAAMSLHNHRANFTPMAHSIADRISMEDPLFGDAFPRANQDARLHFHDWVENDLRGDDKSLSFFDLECSYWDERKRANVLLVHYNDMKKDLGGEMRRIAAFLDITIAESVWPSLIEAAGFEAMQRNGDKIMSAAAAMWEGGSSRFLFKGSNGRWRDVVAPEDLARYDAKVKASFSPALANWVAQGRLVAGDPRESN